MCRSQGRGTGSGRSHPGWCERFPARTIRRYLLPILAALPERCAARQQASNQGNDLLVEQGQSTRAGLVRVVVGIIAETPCEPHFAGQRPRSHEIGLEPGSTVDRRDRIVGLVLAGIVRLWMFLDQN